MKTRNLLLGMACMAAFTACSNNDEPVIPAVQTRAVTINVSTGADTRTALTVDGNGLKRTWAASDKLSIYFMGADNTEVLEVFDLKSGAGTTSAVFEKSDSQLPATGTVKVLVWVQTDNVERNSFDIAIQDGTLDGGNGLTNNDWLVKETTVTDGVFSDLTLESKCIFLKIPAGTKLVNDVTGNHNVEIYVYNDNIVRRYDFSIDGDGNFTYDSTRNDKYVQAGEKGRKIWVALKDGALVKDCYIAMMAKDDITSLKLKVCEENGAFTDKEIAVREFKTPLQFGYIYNITQDDITVANG